MKIWESILKNLVVLTGLLDHYREQDRIEHSQRVGNLEELVSAASDYPSTPEGLAEFLELIELDQASLEEEETDINRVTLITMHNTKGPGIRPGFHFRNGRGAVSQGQPL